MAMDLGGYSGLMGEDSGKGQARFPDRYLGIGGTCLLWAGSSEAAMGDHDQVLDRRPIGVPLGLALAGRAVAHFRLGDDDSARYDMAMLREKIPLYTIEFLRRMK